MKTKAALILSFSFLVSTFSLQQYKGTAAEENVFFEENSYSCNFENYMGTSGWFDNYNIQIVPNGASCEVTTDIEGNGLGFSDVFADAAYLQYNKFASEDKFKICFDIYFDTVPVGGFIATNGSTQTGTRYMNNIIVENGVMKFYSGNDIASSFELKEKTIYSFEYEINNVSKKYSFWINGSLAADNYSLYRSDVITFNNIRIGMNYSSDTAGDFCIDNFSFTDYLLAEGDIFRFEDFDETTAGLNIGDGVNKCEKKDNSYLELTQGAVINTESLSFENTAVVAASLNKSADSEGKILLKDAEMQEIVLIDSQNDVDIWANDEWNEFIFLIDIDESVISVYKDSEIKKKIEIPDTFDFKNVSFQIESTLSEISADDIFVMTDDSAIKDFVSIFNTSYVGGKSIQSENLYAGELDLNVTVYDKRDTKDAVMLVVHKQDEKIVKITSVPFEYTDNIGKASFTDDITYKRNDTVETYLWNSLSEIIPLTAKTKINRREEFMLYPDEAEYAFLKRVAEHPYIAIDKADIEKAKKIYNSTENTIEINTAKAHIESILNEADQLVSADFYDENSEYFIGYRNTSEYVLYIANKIIKYNEILGFSYQLTGNKEYAECLYRIMHITGSSEENENVKYPDWAPEHYLGTAQMSAAFAIGYDWAYDGFSNEQKAEIEKSIYDYGISEGLEGYRNNAAWASYKNNWGMICNSGMILGAAVIADNELYSDECFEVMASAVTHIENVIDLFNEDGLWQESLGYGKQSLDCLIRAIDTLRQGLGNDYGLLSATGLSKSADAYIYLDGPFGSYNFHDSGFSVSNINAYELLWIGREFNNSALINARKNAVKANSLNPTVWDVLCYSDTMDSEEPLLDKYFNVMEMFSLREQNYDKNSLWIAAQAGKNNIDHCHLDCGSFVLDWGGYRWALDLGYDDYNLDGYFYTKRYNYYRVRAEGHNTLVINPSTEKDQKIAADTKIEKFVSRDDYSFAVMDLTSAYDAKSVKRGIYMGDKRKSIVIRDELELNSADDVVYWYMHTDANVNIINNIAYLTKGQKEMQLEFMNEGCDAVIDCVDAKALIELDGTENDNPNNGIKKIRIKLSNGESPRLTVKITPVGTGNSFESINETVSLDNWE